MVRSYLAGLTMLMSMAIAQPILAVNPPATTPITRPDSQTLASLTATLQQNPQDIDAHIERGFLYLQLNQNLAAIDDYNAVIKIDPNHALAYNNRAIAKTHLRDNWGAYLDYTQAIKIRPNQPMTHNYRAVVRQRLGDCKGAIADLRIAAELFRQQGDNVNYQRTLASLKQFQAKIYQKV